MKNFFDDYPLFFNEESGLNSFPNRLNWRYRAIIENGRPVIEGRRILDIASYDGRWAFAAIKAGASHVTGIEIHAGGVEKSRDFMKEYGVGEDRYRFIAGDIESEMLPFGSEDFDTVFCLGFFYHTLYHMTLLDQIKRLDPEFIVFDTHVARSEEPIIALQKEDVLPGGPRGEVYPLLDNQILVGWPSRTALEWMLAQIGYTVSYFDWFAQGIEDWSRLDDYRDQWRVTLVATRANSVAANAS